MKNKKDDYFFVCCECHKNIPCGYYYSKLRNKKSWCKSCSNKRRWTDPKEKIKQSQRMKEVLKSSSVRKNYSTAAIFRWKNNQSYKNLMMNRRMKSMSEESKQKISKSMIAVWKNPEYRKKMADHISHSWLSHKQTYIHFNPICCEILNEMNSRGWNFRHATNHPDNEFCSGGYFADGYDEKKNIWFEYDEPWHESPKQKRKDIYRQNVLFDILGCRMIRFSEKFGLFYEVNRDGSCKKLLELM